MTLFTTEKLIKENPKLVKKFVEATIEGWEYAYQHPLEAVNYTLLYTEKPNREHQTRMMMASLELLKPDEKPIGCMEKEVWENMQKLLLDTGIMKNPVNITEVYTNEFLPNCR